MKVEGMSSISTSYQGQGSSSVSSSKPVAAPEATPGVTTAANATVAPKTVTPKSGDQANGQKGFEISEGTVVREEGQASNEQIREAVEKINKSAQSNGEAVFGIHDATNRVTIKIIDKETREVIKEFPPEKTLDMIAKVWEMAGIMVDEKR
ncbi:MAG: flagellar protein FlaG [Lachnospiraceae bacterium]|nr:flagellar protein FlaG [Lachnospiraceae bacterium]